MNKDKTTIKCLKHDSVLLFLIDIQINLHVRAYLFVLLFKVAINKISVMFLSSNVSFKLLFRYKQVNK